MGKTGTYKIIEGKLIKVSNETPRIASRIDGVYYPGSPYYEYFNGRDPVLITSKGEKKAEMARRGIREKTDEDFPYEKAGKIFSYNGQPHKDRNVHTQKPKKLPKYMKHLTANM